MKNWVFSASVMLLSFHLDGQIEVSHLNSMPPVNDQKNESSCLLRSIHAIYSFYKKEKNSYERFLDTAVFRAQSLADAVRLFKKRNISLEFKPVGKDKKSLFEALKRGPLLVSAMISLSFLNYKSGIYCPPKKQSDGSIPHAMVIVGLDDQKAILRNSYGEHWGQLGYADIRIEDLLNDSFSIGIYEVVIH